MKIYNKFMMGLVLVGSLAATSCVNDLDVPDKDPNKSSLEEVASGDMKTALEQCIAECYQTLATSGPYGAGSSIIGGSDPGATAFTRQVFVLNELTTDEYQWIQLADAGNWEMATMQFSAGLEQSYSVYSRLYANIAVCNSLINNVENLFEIPDDLRPVADEFVRQAKVICGLNYYYLIDCFGNCAYIDPYAPGTDPVQMQRAELYNLVVADLEKVSAEWGDTYAEAPYGYIGKEACDALLARFYLNGMVWANQDNYQKCWDICQKIINIHQGEGFNGTGLAESYIALFGANNEEYTAGGSRAREIIWDIPQDELQLQSYGGSTFYAAAACASGTMADNGFEMNSVTDLNMSSPWTCMIARQQFSERFDFDADGYSMDARAQLWKTSKDGFKMNNDVVVGNSGFPEGYIPVKFTNWAYDEWGNVDMDATPATNDFCSADWPAIRLAEIYLTAAEANIIGNVGNANDALTYINNVRERAGVEPWTDAKMTPSNILDERSRELYGELGRRTDLVRHDKFAGGNYIWNWKGGVHNGTATNMRYNVFPLSVKVTSNQGFVQNPGY